MQTDTDAGARSVYDSRIVLRVLMPRQVAHNEWLNGWHVLITETETKDNYRDTEVIRSCSSAELQSTAALSDCNVRVSVSVFQIS